MNPLRIVRFLVATLFHRAVPWYVKTLLVLALVYIAWPRDLIPDFLIPYGFLDDLVIAPVLAALASRLIPRILASSIWKNSGGHAK